MCHTGQRRRVAGGQQEEKRRGSRWRGHGGGGDVCHKGWLGATLGGTDGIKGLLGIRPFFQPLPSHLSFLHHICSHRVPFFSFSALLPVHALIISPLHHSLSLLHTFISLLPVCI